MKKLILIAVATVALTSCIKKAVSTEKQADFELELLFEKDGCKMYRFIDGGTYIYWSTCEGRASYKDRHYNTATKTTTVRDVQSITTPTSCFPLDDCEKIIDNN